MRQTCRRVNQVADECGIDLGLVSRGSPVRTFQLEAELGHGLRAGEIHGISDVGKLSRVDISRLMLALADEERQDDSSLLEGCSSSTSSSSCAVSASGCSCEAIGDPEGILGSAGGAGVATSADAANTHSGSSEGGYTSSDSSSLRLLAKRMETCSQYNQDDFVACHELVGFSPKRAARLRNKLSEQLYLGDSGKVGPMSRLQISKMLLALGSESGQDDMPLSSSGWQ